MCLSSGTAPLITGAPPHVPSRHPSKQCTSGFLQNTRPYPSCTTRFIMQAGMEEINDASQIAHQDDIESATCRRPKNSTPIPCTCWDRLLENVIHPASALSLCLISLGIIFLGLHVLWSAAWHRDNKALVKAAFQYNKPQIIPDQFVPETSQVNFDFKGLSLVIGTGYSGAMIGLGCALFSYITLRNPREKLLTYVRSHPARLAHIYS